MRLTLSFCLLIFMLFSLPVSTHARKRGRGIDKRRYKFKIEGVAVAETNIQYYKIEIAPPRGSFRENPDPDAEDIVLSGMLYLGKSAYILKEIKLDYDDSEKYQLKNLENLKAKIESLTEENLPKKLKRAHKRGLIVLEEPVKSGSLSFTTEEVNWRTLEGLGYDPKGFQNIVGQIEFGGKVFNVRQNVGLGKSWSQKSKSRPRRKKGKSTKTPKLRRFR
ncbi:hypothetical protein ACFL35_20660 [Candidatus Riflebacteria bacterium]